MRVRVREQPRPPAAAHGNGIDAAPRRGAGGGGATAFADESKGGAEGGDGDVACVEYDARECVVSLDAIAGHVQGGGHGEERGEHADGQCAGEEHGGRKSYEVR